MSGIVGPLNTYLAGIEAGVNSHDAGALPCALLAVDIAEQLTLATQRMQISALANVHAAMRETSGLPAMPLGASFACTTLAPGALFLSNGSAFRPPSTTLGAATSAMLVAGCPVMMLQAASRVPAALGRTAGQQVSIDVPDGVVRTRTPESEDPEAAFCVAHLVPNITLANCVSVAFMYSLLLRETASSSARTASASPRECYALAAQVCASATSST